MLCVILCTMVACDSWLDTTPPSQVPEEDQFDDEFGFRQALIGCYIGMADVDLYGKQLTWYSTEMQSGQYTIHSQAYVYAMGTYQYTAQRALSMLNSVWQKAYNVIANVNNALKFIDKRQGVLDPASYRMIKGELLAIRAMLYFDMMRLYGYGNLAGRTDKSTKPTVPYVTDYDKEMTPQLSYDQTIELIVKDLTDALGLLDDEPITGKHPADYYDALNDDGFFSDRTFRLNYFAVKALLARVYMWEGTDEGYAKAAEIAEEWFLTEDDSGQDCWDWVSRSRVTNSNVLYRDRTFSQEHIWHLSVTKLNDIIGNWLDASNPNATYERIFLTQEMAFSIFEVGEGNDVGVNDYRYSYLLQPQGSGLNNYATLKLDQCNGETNYGQKIPLISTPEMYYICAEVYAQQGNLKKAISYLNTVRRARGITADLDENLTYQEVREEILKEYRKEFVSLGQLFYFYKRWGVESVAGYADIMDDTKYVLPYPDEEVISGNRVQF